MASTTDLARRIDQVGWGLFFVMSGVLLLTPGLPAGSWLVGIGVLLLAVAATRLTLGLGVEWFGAILGGSALLAGSGTIAGVDIPVFALFLIACGIALIVTWFAKGRAER